MHRISGNVYRYPILSPLSSWLYVGRQNGMYNNVTLHNGVYGYELGLILWKVYNLRILRIESWEEYLKLRQKVTRR
jgi:hypothetical protein